MSSILKLSVTITDSSIHKVKELLKVLKQKTQSFGRFKELAYCPTRLTAWLYTQP